MPLARHWLRWLTICLLLFPTLVFSELPKADDRPFWTQKTCFREGEMVFAVGLSTGKNSLEDARKASFKAALWEISNFAQIRDTTLLLVETQMTYEEQNPNNTFSVWRLVKIPFPMIEKARELLTRNAPATRNTVHKIKNLENEDREDLADDLRRALLEGNEKSEPSVRRRAADKTLPTASIQGIHASYRLTDIITLAFQATDDRTLQTLLFSIKGSTLKKAWTIKGKSASGKISFPASQLGPGKQVYTIKITDAAGNVALKSGVFHVTDLHNELYDLLSQDMD